MSVSNGQPGDAPTLNAAFVSKTADSTVTGTVTLDNGETAAIPDLQAKVNANATSITTLTTTVGTLSDEMDTLGGHVGESIGVHGVTGAVVGTTNVQTLYNKTINDPLIVGGIALWEEEETPLAPEGGIKRLYAKADGNLYTMNSAGIEVEVGSGAGGGGTVNFLEGGDAEAGVVGASITGGSLISSTLTPLDGTKSFWYSPVGVAGSGWEFDFEVPSIWRAKKLQIELWYNPSSEYVDDDLYLEIEAPSGASIEPVGKSIKKVGLPSIHYATFQTESTGSSYKLKLRQATANDAYDFQFKVFVGPQITTQGAFAQYLGEKTTTGSWTTNATYTGKYWRTADGFLTGKVRVSLSGAPTATGLSIALPAGHTIDTDRLVTPTAGVTPLGDGSTLDSGVAAYPVSVKYVSATAVGIYVRNAASTYAVYNNLTATVPFTFGSGDAVDVTFSVPILGWGSSQVLSSEVSGRSISFAAYKGANQSITANTITTVAFGNKRMERGGSNFSTSTGRFTASESGDYLFSYTCYYTTGGTAPTEVDFYFRVNDTGIYAPYVVTSLAASKIYPASGSTTLYLTAGQYVDLICYSATQGVTVNGTGGTAEWSSFSGHKVSPGAQQIAQAELVSAQRGLAVGQVIPNGAITSINLDTASYDTHGMWQSGVGYNSTTGAYTTRPGWVVPYAGKYRIELFVMTDSTAWTATNNLQCGVQVNGSAVRSGLRWTADASVTILGSTMISTTVDCLAEDLVSPYIYISRSGGATLYSGTLYTHATITRVG